MYIKEMLDNLGALQELCESECLFANLNLQRHHLLQDMCTHMSIVVEHVFTCVHSRL